MMTYTEAARLDIASASPEELTAAWHAHASQISYLNADDYGGDWKLVPPIADHARAIEREMRNRRLERPTGSYLMSQDDRIDWDTGEWSPGWHWKKAAAEQKDVPPPTPNPRVHHGAKRPDGTDGSRA